MAAPTLAICTYGYATLWDQRNQKTRPGGVAQAGFNLVSSHFMFPVSSGPLRRTNAVLEDAHNDRAQKRENDPRRHKAYSLRHRSLRFRLGVLTMPQSCHILKKNRPCGAAIRIAT
jgi:hypothetical protein